MSTHPSSLIPHPSPWRWWVCGALLLATFLNYMDRQALAVALPELGRAHHLHPGRVGLVEGCFGLAFAAGSVAFGLLADRVGPRGLYPVVLAGWSLAGVASAFAGDPRAVAWLERPGDDPGAGAFRWLLFWRTALGAFEAGHWPCALIAARQVLARAERTLGNGLLQSGGATASICVPLYAELVERFGGNWQVTFWSVGAAGLLWVPLWLLLVRRGDLADRPVPADEPEPAAGPGARAGLVRRVLVLGLIVSTLTVSWQFLRAWLTLLLDFRGYGRVEARLATSGYFVAAEVGCLLVGVVVLRQVRGGRDVRSARVRAFAGYVGLTAAAALVPFAGSGGLMVAGLMVAGAGILGLHPLYYALSQELPHRHMGVMSGALAAGGWVVASVFQILIGARIQATNSYDVGLTIAGLAPLAGLVALLALWPRDRPAGG